MSGDGEWVLAVAAWDGGDILGLVALTEPPRATLETESDYWFEQTGVISGAWKTPSIFAGQSEDGPTALFKSGTVQLPSTPRDMTTTTVADFSICPQVAPTFLPHGVEGGPGNQPGVVWQAAGTLVVISYTTNPAHPAVNLSGGTSLKFVGGSARYASLRPDDPQSNFIALIDLDGLDPACGSLTAEFHSLVAEEVEQVLTSLVVVAASN